MWVRNQKRDRLSNCVEFYLQEKLKESYAVLGVAKNCTGHIIATYSTKEKALKVLDMIQERIGFLNECLCIATKKDFIFQMPLDSEVVDDEI